MQTTRPHSSVFLNAFSNPSEQPPTQPTGLPPKSPNTSVQWNTVTQTSLSFNNRHTNSGDAVSLLTTLTNFLSQSLPALRDSLPGSVSQYLKPKRSEQDIKTAIQNTVFQVTAAFEASSPSAIQTVDSGIISYGQHQATLASGTLETVLKEYFAHSESATARKLIAYQQSVQEKSSSLRSDQTFLSLLRAAGEEVEMREAQDRVFYEHYYVPAANAAATIGLTSPLALAIFFDTNVQGGLAESLRLTVESIGNHERPDRYTREEEQTFLKEFLFQREARLLRIADRKEENGDVQSAEMLRKSADYRIKAFSSLLEGGNLDLYGTLNINGHAIQGLPLQ